MELAVNYVKLKSNVGAVMQNVVLKLSSDEMGRGDSKLGKKLLTTFLSVICELENRPSKIVFFNSGVKLSCEGSEVVDQLMELESNGTLILNCGTCLNYYDLNKNLLVGKESNMVEISNALFEADKIIGL